MAQRSLSLTLLRCRDAAYLTGPGPGLICFPDGGSGDRHPVLAQHAGGETLECRRGQQPGGWSITGACFLIDGGKRWVSRLALDRLGRVRLVRGRLGPELGPLGGRVGVAAPGEDARDGSCGRRGSCADAGDAGAVALSSAKGAVG